MFEACYLMCGSKAHLVLDFGIDIKHSFFKIQIFHFFCIKEIVSLYEAKLFCIKKLCSITNVD